MKYNQMPKVGFGSQIRNYFLHPDQRVKDARTGFSVGSFHSVLDGNIQGFLDAYLRYRAAGGESRRARGTPQENMAVGRHGWLAQPQAALIRLLPFVLRANRMIGGAIARAPRGHLSEGDLLCQTFSALARTNYLRTNH